MEMLRRDCPICASSEGARTFAEANFDLAQLDGFAFASRKIPEYMHCRLQLCPRCGLLYADPALAPGALAEAYREAAFDSGPEAGFAARTYARVLKGFSGRLPDKAGTLDIGTGDGVFLGELLKAGFTGVEGVEPSESPVAAAKPDIKPLIHLGIFKPGEYPAAKYSLVTCFQTLEHVPDPLGIAKDVLRVLKPGGAFYIISHNRLALSAKVLGKKSPIFDIEHLQLFSPQSAKELFEKAGFTGVETKVVLNIYPLHYWIKMLPLPRALKPGLIRFLKAVGIGHLPLPMPAGNLAVVGFKAKN